MTATRQETSAQAAYTKLERENRGLSPAEWIAFLEELTAQCRAGISAAREDLLRG